MTKKKKPNAVKARVSVGAKKRPPPKKKPRAKPIADMKPLSDLALRFVHEYMIDCNGAQAAIRAGYAPAHARKQAYLLMQDPRIETLIAEARAKLTEDLQLERDTIARELASIGFASMRSYVEIDKDGNARINLGKLTEDQFKALSEIQVEEEDRTAKGRGKRVRIKLHDKRAALVDLAKLLGYHKEIHLHGLTQPASDTPAVPWIIQPVAPPPGSGPR